MNLTVDIGNSSAKAAVFKDGEIVWRRRLGADLANGLSQIAAEFDLDACAFSSVGRISPDVAKKLRLLAPHTLEVTGTTPTPLVCDYLTPETLGADRLAAAVGGAHCCPAHDLLIVDAGTCITYDFVSATGHYAGGNISPGLGMRLRVLHEQTASLPAIGQEGDSPEVGRDTATAIRTGVLLGMDYEIKGYIRAFGQKHPDGRVFVTGGNGYRFARELEVERNDALVEIGLNCILEHQTR